MRAGHFTATAAYDVAESEGPARLDDGCDTDDNADDEYSSILACAGVARVRTAESGEAD